jgi:hypothetical protein
LDNWAGGGGTRRGPEPPAYWGDGREARQNRLTADGEVRT